ncbi:glycosyltransferase family 1 protein [Porphyromonas sp. COT-239 OH1446]|uniref:glycosyltransferase family 1 protein n=1 Tax=Porphyromonas sp. COT-239 OH1446 TaxID=1515613 RepID=UPI00052DFEEB|nr:glycosyltransferase family 1 protein [Porphyromonas sp. COT-239 OH1446]KGN70211.1 hypothetical protein HQ37_03975 [Porphyromonas sp. COT-239 OH1446]
MKRRILEVVGRMDRAGQETFLMNVLRTHDPDKYEFTFSVNTSHVGSYEPEILALGGRVWHNPYPVTWSTVYKNLKAFRLFLREYGPFDVIHCHVFHFGGLILRVAKEAGIPTRIMHSHSTTDGYRDTLWRKLYRSLSFRLIETCATHKVACGIDAYKSLFRQECPDSRFILNNAVAIHDFIFPSLDKAEIRKRLGIPLSAQLVISVARFVPVKNHSKIVEIFSKFYDRCPDGLLFLVGDGEVLESIQNLVQQKNLESVVKFLGNREDIPFLLGASDILLMPSLFEGLPVTLVEAQASGLPCLISDNISKEVDMGLGLVKFVSLDLSSDYWAETLVSIIDSKFNVSASERIKGLTRNGYTIESTWNKLRLLYG